MGVGLPGEHSLRCDWDHVPRVTAATLADTTTLVAIGRGAVLRRLANAAPHYRLYRSTIQSASAARSGAIGNRGCVLRLVDSRDESERDVGLLLAAYSRLGAGNRRSGRCRHAATRETWAADLRHLELGGLRSHHLLCTLVHRGDNFPGLPCGSSGPRSGSLHRGRVFRHAVWCRGSPTQSTGSVDRRDLVLALPLALADSDDCLRARRPPTQLGGQSRPGCCLGRVRGSVLLPGGEPHTAPKILHAAPGTKRGVRGSAHRSFVCILHLGNPRSRNAHSVRTDGDRSTGIVSNFNTYELSWIPGHSITCYLSSAVRSI